MSSTTATANQDSRPSLPVDLAPRPVAACACTAPHRFRELADVLAWLADDPSNTAEDYPGPGWNTHADPEGWPDWTDADVWNPAEAAR